MNYYYYYFFVWEKLRSQDKRYELYTERGQRLWAIFYQNKKLEPFI